MNLPTKHLLTLQTLFSKHPTIAQALLFGSRALGTHKEGSDIDIALKGDITPTLIAHLKSELEDSTLPYFCDIISYENAPQELKEHIDTHALPLYTQEEQWQEVRLGEVVEIVNGYAFKSKDFLSTKIDNALPIVKIKNVANGDVNLDDVQYHLYDSKLHRYVIRKSDILISLTGNHPHANTQVVGKVSRYKLEQEALLNQRVANIYPKANVDKDFLYYFLKLDSTHKELASKSTGSGNQANISKADIESLIISLPPLERQKEIAEILSSFDDKIDFLHRQNRTLESLAQTLFRHYFIDNAKEEWEEKPLSEIATFLNGLACQKIPPKNESDKLPVLKIKELREGKISESSDWATSEVEERFIVNQGDIVFSWSATLMVEIWGGEKCVLNQHLFKVITDKGYPQWFCYFWCKHHLNKFKSIASAHATTMGHIRRQDLDNAMCRIPSQEFINKLDSEISPLMSKLVKNFKEVKDLEFFVKKVIKTSSLG